MKRQTFRALLTTGVFATSLLTSSNAMAAVDMFLKIDGVTGGESQDETHKGEMDVLAWSWGQSTGEARTGRGKGSAVCIQDLSITKYIDSASPELIMNSMVGKLAPTAVLVVRKAGENPLEFLTLTMRNVTVSAYTTGGYWRRGSAHRERRAALRVDARRLSPAESQRQSGAGSYLRSRCRCGQLSLRPRRRDVKQAEQGDATTRDPRLPVSIAA